MSFKELELKKQEIIQENKNAVESLNRLSPEEIRDLLEQASVLIKNKLDSVEIDSQDSDLELQKRNITRQTENLSKNLESVVEFVSIVNTLKEVVKKSSDVYKAIDEFFKSHNHVESNGSKIPVTSEVFTYADDTVITDKKLETYVVELFNRFEGKYPDRMRFLSDMKNWVQERAEIHQEIIREELAGVDEFTQAMKEKQGENYTPTVYALRGNTASGKSTTVRNEFGELPKRNGKTAGVINMDEYKAWVRELERNENGEQRVTMQKVHWENSNVAYRVEEELLNEEHTDKSYILDKRFSDEKAIRDLIKSLKNSGKKLEIIDIDVPLELSLLRVLSRDKFGSDPIPDYKAIRQGFVGIRSNRNVLIKTQIMINPENINYKLKVYDVISKKDVFIEFEKDENSTLKPKKEFEELYDTVTRIYDKKDSLLEDSLEINNSYIEQIKLNYKFDEGNIIIKNIRKYLAEFTISNPNEKLTFEKLIEIHAKIPS